MIRPICLFRPIAAALGLTLLVAPAINAQQAASRMATGAVIPGTGTRIDFVGDKFENPEWGFIHNHPKSSREQDEQLRFPVGKSLNERWYEGPERGHPDLMKVVETPPGALPGSDYCLLVQTLNSGIPGRRSLQVQQDDLIVDLANRIGHIPVSEVPNVTTRVYLPPSHRWEDRTGPHFGFRITTNANVTKSEQVRGRFGRTKSNRYQKREQYWPGIWIHFRSSTDQNVAEDSAFITVRGNRLGHDMVMKEIPASDFGWWTLGMSVTRDGKVHFYASPGSDDLTEEDYLTSQYPYSYRALQFETFFYDFCNRDDGQTWSTPFLIDDPELYVMHPFRISNIVNRKVEMMARREAARSAQAHRQAEMEQSALDSRRGVRHGQNVQPRTALRNPNGAH